MGYVGVIILERERERASSASGLLRERERARAIKTDNAVFEWLGARAQARPRVANAGGVPAGMFSVQFRIDPI